MMMIEEGLDNNFEESNYCGEYFQKNRAKPDGKTYKKKYWDKHHELTIERHSTVSLTQKYDKLHEVAVTDLDSYFDYGFWKKPTSSYYPANERPLNTPDKWENIEDFLENNAVRKTKEFHRSEGLCKTHFEVPVTGHVLCANIQVAKNRKNKFEGWLLWNGKVHDPSYVYLKNQIHTKETLTKLCPVIVGREDPLMELGYTDETKKMHRIAKSVLSSRNKKRMKPYLEMDLGRVHVLDHIGTYGAYPKSLDVFPPRETMTKDTEAKKKEKRNFVCVVNSEYDLAWVTKYIIHYRDIVTGKWIVYEHPLDGNADVTTEVIHKISIMARYVRIVPLDFHHQKEMRVLLYGEPFQAGKKQPMKVMKKSTLSSMMPFFDGDGEGEDEEQQLENNGNHHKKKQQRRSKRITNEENEEQYETIRYTLHPVSTNWSLNQGCGRHCRMCHPGRYGADSKHQAMFRLLQEEQQCWRDSFVIDPF